MIRGMRLAAALLAVLMILGQTPRLLATCGGGGGGGRGGAGKPPPTPPPPAGGGAKTPPPGGSNPTPAQPQVYLTKWTSTLEDAIKGATEKKKAVVLYFEPKNKVEHPDFKAKMMADWSKDHFFFKVVWTKDDPLRKDYKVTEAKDNAHIVIVCDGNANAIKTFDAPITSPFPYAQIEDTLRNLDKLVDKLKKDLEGKITGAAKAVEGGKFKDSIKALLEILAYKGFDVCRKASDLMIKVEESGDKAIDEALKIEDKKARVEQLKKIKTDYKGVKKIEDRCDQSIKDATGKAPEREASQELADLTPAERVWNQMFGAVDYSKRAPITSERAYRALTEGLQHELAERYEKALECYAIAAGLDPKDPIPLVFLGETYRHHLGRWDDARKAFDRVIELDNDDYAVAVALHGIGKMTIWNDDNETGLKLFDQSIKRYPTALCYRNLAVYWNTEKEFKKAFGYATQAFELDPGDTYNRVFYAVYLILDGQRDKAEELINTTEFDVSMSYNYACYYAAQGKREMTLKYLHKHFYEYEKTDDVRAKEMAEARMDIHFASLKSDPEFVKLTALAGK